MIPRVSGNVIQLPNGRFSFELFFGSMEENVCDHYTFKQEFETREDAMKVLKEAVRECCDVIEKKMTGEISGKYIDLNAKELRTWGTEQ